METSQVTKSSVRVLLDKIQGGTFPEVIADWKWILHFTKKYKWAVVYYTFVGILSSTFGLVSAVASKYTIDIVTEYKMEQFPLLAAIMVGTLLLSLLLNSLLSRISAKLSLKIYNDIQSEIFNDIISADWLSISAYDNGDIVNRFNSDVSTVANNAITWIPSIVIAVYQFITTFLVIWHYNSTMALIAFISAPVLLLVSRFVIGRQRYYNRETKVLQSELMSFEMESVYNLDTLKAFGITSNYSKKLTSWQERYKDLALRNNMFSIGTNILYSLTGAVVQFTAFGYCLYLLWTHSITYGTMTLFLQQRSKLSSTFSKLVSIIPNFLNSSVSANRIRELCQLPKEITDGEVCERCNTSFENGLNVIFDSVDFAYIEDHPVLENSSFQAHPGEIVALIGPSGEGKTTTVRLLLGLVHPQAGTISIQGSGVDESPNAGNRDLYSYVPQGNTLLSGSIAENLRMVKPDATDEEITDALKTACAWRFVKNIPDTINGKLGERGLGLSEGQAQRVSIARALLRDAPILLLDEATSALDIKTEQAILKNIMKKEPNRTIIVTTHRYSVLSSCNRVYNIQDCRIEEITRNQYEQLSHID